MNHSFVSTPTSLETYKHYQFGSPGSVFLLDVQITPGYDRKSLYVVLDTHSRSHSYRSEPIVTVTKKNKKFLHV